MPEAIIRKGKKIFYPIIAPKLFDEQELGEIPLYDLRESIGRTLKLNLMALTNDPKRQNVNISFQISSVDGQRARTEIIGYNLTPNSIRRMVKRKKIRLDDSFVVKTSDNKLIRIKPFLVTAGLARSGALKGLQRNLRIILTKNIAKMNYETFLNELISYRLENDLRAQLKKTYPLVVCKIRAMEIEKEKKKEEEEEVKKKEIKKEKVEKKEKTEKKVKEEKKVEEKPKEVKKEVKKEKTVSKKEK